MDRRSWFVVAAVIALALAAGAVCVCGGVGYFVWTVPDAQVQDERAEREGMAAGQSGTTEGCITTAHERTITCGVIDVDCALGAQTFLRSCLRSVPAPDRSICTGVPELSALGDWDFADSLCRARGWDSDSGQCDPIAEALSLYCH